MMQLHDRQILVQRIGRALIPVGPKLLLCRNDFDELAELAAQEVPAALHVTDKRMRLVLSQHGDPADTGVDAIGQDEINDAEFAAKLSGGLATIGGQVFKSFATTAGHDDGQGTLRQAADIALWRYLLAGKRFFLARQYLFHRNLSYSFDCRDQPRQPAKSYDLV
jgi:hypothetical protein